MTTTPEALLREALERIAADDVHDSISCAREALRAADALASPGAVPAAGTRASDDEEELCGSCPHFAHAGICGRQVGDESYCGCDGWDRIAVSAVPAPEPPFPVLPMKFDRKPWTCRCRHRKLPHAATDEVCRRCGDTPPWPPLAFEKKWNAGLAAVPAPAGGGEREGLPGRPSGGVGSGSAAGPEGEQRGAPWSHRLTALIEQRPTLAAWRPDIAALLAIVHVDAVNGGLRRCEKMLRERAAVTGGATHAAHEAAANLVLSWLVGWNNVPTATERAALPLPTPLPGPPGRPESAPATPTVQTEGRPCETCGGEGKVGRALPGAPYFTSYGCPTCAGTGLTPPDRREP